MLLRSLICARSQRKCVAAALSGSRLLSMNPLRFHAAQDMAMQWDMMALGAARKPNSTPVQLTRLSLPRPHNQALLLEVVQRMSDCSPVTAVGDAIWGDESGIVHVLQFNQNIQHLIDSHTAIQSFAAQTPQLHIHSMSSELYTAPTMINDTNLQQSLYIEFTWSNLSQRRGTSASFVAAHTRYAEQRVHAQQGQRVWLQALAVSRFKALEVWLHSDASTLPPCSNEVLNEGMDGVFDDLHSARLEGGKSVICNNCSNWLK